MVIEMEEKFEDIIRNSKNVEICVIKRKIILKYLIEGKNGMLCKINQHKLHDIIIQQTKKYYNTGDLHLIDSDIILNRTEIKNILQN